MDKKISHKIQQHPDDHIDEIVREYYPCIQSFVYRRVANQALSKDITQDVFYSFFKHQPSYKEQGKLLNYLYHCARNKIIDYYRLEKQRVDNYNLDYAVDPKLQPQQFVNKESEIHTIQNCIHRLSPIQQDIIILRFYEDLKYKDIARITGLNVSTVKSRIKVALQDLETMWREGEKNE